MRRSLAVAQFPLVAIFCVALTGSAAAATPTISGGNPPTIGTQITGNPDPLFPTDSIGWETCGTYQVGGLYPPTAPVNVPYTLALSDAGSDICAVELATGAVVDGISAGVGPVEGLPAGAGPRLTANSQTLTQGQPLLQGQPVAVVPGAWGAAQSISDDWSACDATGANCTPLAAGVPTYTPTRADVGSTIEVSETATASNNASSSAATPLTGLVSAVAPNNTSSPTVSGTAQVGDTLTVAPGSWSNTPTTYTYQWDRCAADTCTPISGATASTYVPVAADVGDVLVAYVTGAIDPGTPYGAVGSPYPSYPTSPVLGIATSPPPSAPPPGPVVPVPNPHTSKAVGRLTATMQWTFRYAPTYTQILALAVEGPALGSTIATRCSGRGCPLRVHRITVRKLRRCAHTWRHCPAPRTLNLEWEFHRHRLGIGTRVTIRISRPRDIGKYYRFVVRARRPPSVRISCLAPGSVTPGKGCSLR